VLSSVSDVHGSAPGTPRYGCTRHAPRTAHSKLGSCFSWELAPALLRLRVPQLLLLLCPKLPERLWCIRDDSSLMNLMNAREKQADEQSSGRCCLHRLHLQHPWLQAQA
jgi:hypothetical protein